MRKFILFIASTSLLVSAANAQQVSGVVKDQQGKGLDKSTISLLRAKDSSVVKLSVTKDDGRYSIIAVQPGNYLVSASHVGYMPLYSKVFELSGSGETNLPDLVLTRVAGELKAVTVTATKPMVEVKADKTILNVEGTINATGNDALELLRKSPGVLVDKDDNVSLLGKNGVQIYVDGKPSPLSGGDLTAYLKSLQSSQIESIEIITNPSAKYDAAGNAGIINIRLKKNKSFGTNGSVNSGYNIGTYGKYNEGLALNHRNKNINIFGNYNFNHGLNDNAFKLYRDVADTIFDQKNNITNKNNNHGFKAGIDYFINKKSTVGVLVNGNISNNTLKTNGLTKIIYKPTGVIDRILKGDNTSAGDRKNMNFNLNYRYADTAGHELNVDADYGLFRIRTDQLQPNIYYNPAMTAELSRLIFSFLSPSDIDIYTLKADYEQNYKGGKLGLGFKTALTRTDNNFGSYDVVGNAKVLDVTKSNQFNYKENINAIYLNFNKGYKGIVLQAGLRMENTNSTGDSYPLNSDGSVNYSSKQRFSRHYTDLFPSAAITFKKNPMKQWSFSYSRRIDRPAYQDLNPFLFKLNVYTYQKGNTELRPQYTNSIGLTNIYKYKLTSTLNYSHVNDVFTQLVDTAEISKAFLTKKNLATQDIVSLNISYPFMYKNYTLFTNLNTYYSMYRADFGGGNRKVNVNVFSYNLYMQNSLKLDKKKLWTAELSGFYNAPSIWQGTFKSKALWAIDGGLQKTIFKGKGNLKVAVSDIFHTLKWRGTSNFAGQTTIASGNWESRQFKINLSYRFGSNQVKAARNRKLGAEEENQRTQSGGGIGQ
jgi:Outer membrane protein beta-barrel family/Carboxypeptidase regulatory-like domain/TonB-dependent Receptor Plug Domain